MGGGGAGSSGEAGLEGMVAGEEWFKACLALSSDVSVDRLREWFGVQSYVRGGRFCCPCLLYRSVPGHRNWQIETAVWIGPVSSTVV